MRLATISSCSESDYLGNEHGAPDKHEYVAGEVFAMARASKRHGTLALNAAISLRQHLRSQPCDVWMTDMKVRVRADSAYYYPDVMVTCDPADLGPAAPKDFLEAPKLVVEVLSDSTERIDSREKLFAYQNIEALEEYVLLAQDKHEATPYRRAEDWSAVRPGGEGLLELASVGLSVALEQLYEGAGA